MISGTGLDVESQTTLQSKKTSMIQYREGAYTADGTEASAKLPPRVGTRPTSLTSKVLF